MLASSHPPLVHHVTRPVKPLCHSRTHARTHIHTQGCTDTHTGRHKHTPFQLLDQGVGEEDEDAERQIRKWAREIDFFFTGEKTEVLFTDLRAIEKKELCQK